MGMSVRNSFRDVVTLRQVHRYVDEKPELSSEQQEQYKKDAVRFLQVTRGMKVVHAISQAKTRNDNPIEPIKMHSISIAPTPDEL